MRIIIPEFNYVLTDNASLNKTWREYEAPIISYTTIVSDGYGGYMLLLLGLSTLLCLPTTELSVKEIRPPRMDDSGRKKYPVLFRV